METNLKLVLTARFFDKLSDNLIMFAVPLMIYKATGSLSSAGFAFFVERLPRILFAPLSGPLADSFTPRKAMLYSNILRSGLCFLLASVGTDIQNSAVLIPLIASMICLLNLQAFVSVDGLIVQFSGAENKLRGYSYLQLADQAPLLLAPLFTILLSPYMSLSFFIISSAVLFALSSLTLKFVTSTARNTNTISFGDISQKLIGGFHNILSEPRIYGLLWMSFLANLAVGILMASSAGVVTDLLSLKNLHFAYLNTASGVISIGVILAINRFKSRANTDTFKNISLCCLTLGCLFAFNFNSFLSFALSYILIVSPVGLLNIYVRTERANILNARTTASLGAIVFFNQSALPIAGLIVWAGTALIEINNLFVAVGSLLAVTWFLGLHKTIQPKLQVN